MAEALHQAITDPRLRQRAREYNLELIARRADYETCMAQAAAFYRQLL